MANGDSGSHGSGDGRGWEERRAHQRVSVVAEVWLGQGGCFSRSQERLTNLGLGGAFIELQGFYQVGTVFDLRIELDGQYINSTAIVRRALPNTGAGVEFLDLSPESRQYLAAFIERHAS